MLGCHRRTAFYAARLDALLQKYPAENAPVWCNHGNWQGRREYMPRSWFGDGREAHFEGLPVTIPADFHQYLTQKYGDYQNDPPKEQQKSHHKYTTIDCTRPYTDYREG